VSTSKQYLAKVKQERDWAKSSSESWQNEAARLCELRVQDAERARQEKNSIMASVSNERETARLVSAERERAKFAEDARFDRLVNDVVATAVRTTIETLGGIAPSRVVNQAPSVFDANTPLGYKPVRLQ